MGPWGRVQAPPVAALGGEPMQIMEKRLRIMTVRARPLHLQELLWEGRSDEPGSRDRASEAPASLAAFLQAAATLQARVASALERVGLDPLDHDILDRLRTSDGPLEWAALETSRRPSEVRAALDSLAKRGFVRVLDGSAELTPVGTAMALEGATQVEVVRAQFAAALTSSERVGLGRMLGKLGTRGNAGADVPTADESIDPWRV